MSLKYTYYLLENCYTLKTKSFLRNCGLPVGYAYDFITTDKDYIYKLEQKKKKLTNSG